MMIERHTEIIPQRVSAPIEIIYFGNHDDYKTSKNALARADKAIERSLQGKSAGNTVVGIEDAAAPHIKARQIEKFVAEGKLPSLSFGVTEFVINPKSFPGVDLNKVNELLRSKPQVIQEMLNIIDKHAVSSKRIRLLWESKSEKRFLKEEFLGLFNPKKVFLKRFQKCMNLMDSGDHMRGLKLYKKMVTEFAEYNKERDYVYADSLSKKADEEDTAGVVVFRGAGHTLLGQLLAKRGYNITSRLPDHDGRAYFFSPTDQAIRHMLFTDRQLSEFEWYKLLISEAIYTKMQQFSSAIKKKPGKEMRDQDLLKLTLSQMRRFRDMNSVFKYLNAIKKEKIVGALNVLK